MAIDVDEIFRDPDNHLGALTHLVKSAMDKQARRRYLDYPAEHMKAFVAFLSLPNDDLAFAYVRTMREEGVRVDERDIAHFQSDVATTLAAIQRDAAPGQGDQ